MKTVSYLAATGDNQTLIPIILGVVAVALVVLLVALIVMMRKRNK